MNCAIFELDTLDYVFCQRQLMAYHAQKAYQLNIDQNRATIMEARR